MKSKGAFGPTILIPILLAALVPGRNAWADHFVYYRNPYTGQVYAVRARSPGEPNTPARPGASGPARAPSPAPRRPPAHTRAQARAAGNAWLRFVAWQDPAEGAFSVNVPKGWKVRGGTVRTTAIEPHYVVRAYSPDGGAMLFWDDPRLLIRQVPNLYTARLGLRPGQIIPSAWGGRLLLERYEPAASAALEYARGFLCRRPTRVEGGRILEQWRALTERFGPIAEQEGKRIVVDAGEVAFHCGKYVGYVYAVTLGAEQPGSPAAIWFVYRLGGYMATSADSAAASAGIHEMLATFRMNPAWLEAFARQSHDMAGNVIRESNAITQTTVQRAQAQDKELSSEFKAWHKNFDQNFNSIEHANSAITANGSAGGGSGHDYNAQLDTKTVCDDVGHCQQVDASITNWWADCSGTFHPGAPDGAPPSSSTSACWQKAH